MTLLQGCIEENTRLRFQKAATSAITLSQGENEKFSLKTFLSHIVGFKLYSKIRRILIFSV